MRTDRLTSCFVLAQNACQHCQSGFVQSTAICARTIGVDKWAMFIADHGCSTRKSLPTSKASPDAIDLFISTQVAVLPAPKSKIGAAFSCLLAASVSCKSCNPAPALHVTIQITLIKWPSYSGGAFTAQKRCSWQSSSARVKSCATRLRCSTRACSSAR
jgi:hypothetical protein